MLKNQPSKKEITIEFPNNSLLAVFSLTKLGSQILSLISALSR